MVSIKSIKTFIKVSGVKSILQTKAPNLNRIHFDELKLSKSFVKKIQEDTAYHGSPFNFNFFDSAKIGTGEGFSKRGKGLYIARGKRCTPYYANIRSKDAPARLTRNKPLENPDPHVYTISGINSLKLKEVSPINAKKIARRQEQFEKENPFLDGIELPSGEICVFTKSMDKLKIKIKETLDSFLMKNIGYEFREWTTDTTKIAKYS